MLYACVNSTRVNSTREFEFAKIFHFRFLVHFYFAKMSNSHREVKFYIPTPLFFFVEVNSHGLVVIDITRVYARVSCVARARTRTTILWPARVPSESSQPGFPSRACVRSARTVLYAYMLLL